MAVHSPTSVPLPSVRASLPRRRSAAALLGCVVAAGAALGIARGAEPAVAKVPELVRTKQQVFSIPFRLAPPQTADQAPQRVLLNVSKDLGGTWEPAGEAAPAAGSITYRAGADGEYWFRLRSIDGKGRTRGGEGPDVRVLVDAAGPRIAARVWRGGDGEIICRYAAIDDSLKMDTLEFEYHGKADQGWKKIAAEGILSRESPAHMVGEEIWWAGEQVDFMQVRIAITDAAGNRSTKQFTMETTDPGVDQAGLARELGVPPLPGEVPSQAAAQTSPAPAPAAPPPPRAGVSALPVSTAPDAASRGWPAESVAAFSADQQTPSQASTSSVLIPPSGPSDSAPPAAAPGIEAAAPAPSALQAPSEYRGKPLQLVRSRRFAWDYEMQADRPDTGPLRVELWSTRDGGVTWQRSAVDDDATSPIDVTLPAAGLYGFRLEIVADQSTSGGGPRPGDVPEGWIGVDDEPPQVEVVQALRAPTGEPAGVIIRYAARDQLLVPRSLKLLYSPSVDGPWATITEGLEPQGEYRWQPDRTAPSKVFIRAEATDAAGNIGRGTTPAEVVISATRVVGKLGGIKALP